jgi:NADH-quinone oxidoreductase subunit E
VTAEVRPGERLTLSPELRQRILDEFPKYPEKRAVLLTALHFVQAEHGGWVPHELVAELAELHEIPAIDVAEVISFYSLFHAEPVGRFHIQVCTNLSCCLRGARGLVNALSEALDVLPGERTEDGMFSLAEVQCLGSCGTAPVLQVNNERFDEQLTTDRAAALVERLRQRGAGDAGANGKGDRV